MLLLIPDLNIKWHKSDPEDYHHYHILWSAIFFFCWINNARHRFNGCLPKLHGIERFKFNCFADAYTLSGRWSLESPTSICITQRKGNRLEHSPGERMGFQRLNTCLVRSYPFEYIYIYRYAPNDCHDDKCERRMIVVSVVIQAPRSHLTVTECHSGYVYTQQQLGCESAREPFHDVSMYALTRTATVISAATAAVATLQAQCSSNYGDVRCHTCTHIRVDSNVRDWSISTHATPSYVVVCVCVCVLELHRIALRFFTCILLAHRRTDRGID